MKIEKRDIEYKKRIGTWHGKPVIEAKTTGGYYIVTVPTSGGAKVLGAGSHRAVARHLAQKNEPDLEITELSKSDWLPLEVIQSVEAKYQILVDNLNAAMAGELE